MSDLNGPENEEMERRLQAAFATTRPRRGFEDELWTRLQRRRPWWRRAVATPWPALAAVATVLLIGVVAVLVPRAELGAGSHWSAGGGANPASAGPSTATSEGAAGLAPQPAQLPGANLARVPAPALANPQFGGGGPAEDRKSAGAVPYFGPARLTVTAQPPAVPGRLPVYRYTQPTSADRDAFAASVGAQRASGPETYRGPDFVLTFEMTKGGGEPRFQVSLGPAPPAGSAPPAAEAERIARDFLDSHHLRPSWSAEANVDTASSAAVVSYRRQFEVPGLGKVGQVDDLGSPTGLQVLVGSGRTVTLVTGPFPLPLDSAPYPTRTPGQAAQDAAAQSAPATAGPEMPTINLDQVELVYIAVRDGDRGYLVPAYLFSGKGVSGNATIQKRVLVPALAASSLK